MPLGRLLYTSRCAQKPGGQYTAPDVEEIVAASAERNRAACLTGSLIRVDGHFIQVLEGPPVEIERTFERICCDFRHEDIKLIELSPIEARLFEDWNMACLSADEDTSISLREDLHELRFIVGVNAREALRKMRELLETHSAAHCSAHPAGGPALTTPVPHNSGPAGSGS